jgi:hypothetical protein
MVRPESCTKSAGESPDRVSAGAPGSRHRVGVEISQSERCVKSLARGSGEAGRNKVNISASSNYQPKGVRESRAGHSTAKDTNSILKPDCVLGLPGVWMAACFEGTVRNRRGPTRQPASGKDRWYKAEAESQGVGRESEGFIVPMKFRKRDGGKEPCIG